MLRLILLFLLKNDLWVTRSPKGYQGGIWAAICSDMGADFPGWLALETVGWWFASQQPAGGWFANNQPAGWLFANHQPAGWLFANHQRAGWWFANHQPAGWWLANNQPAGWWLCLDFAYFFAIHFGRCFVTNEVPWGFEKLSMTRV